MYKYLRVRGDGGVAFVRERERSVEVGVRSEGGQVGLLWFISLGDLVHPIDYSGGAVLVRLSRGHLFPKRGFQS